MSTIKVEPYASHILIKVWDTNTPGAKLIREIVAEPGESMTFNVWMGREVTITEIRSDHPMISGVKPPAQPVEAEAA